MRTAFLALLLVFLLGATEASAQTTPTFGEKAVGSTDCKNGAFAADFDTLAQCTSTSSTTGTMQKAPIFVGAVTSPPYPSTTCDSSKAGMIQYTASAMQYCNGTAWTSFGATASGTNAQSMVAGWPDAIICTVTEPSAYGTVVMQAHSLPYGDGLYRYALGGLVVRFTAAGAFSSQDFTTSNCNKSIAQLIAGGQAFNFANGQAGGTAEMQDGTAGAPGLYFSADPNTGFYRPAADTVAIATNGSEKVRINASGQVALNNITPTAGAILDLAGGTGTALSSMIVPKDTTANRPTTGVEGMIRYNTTTKAFEGYAGTTAQWTGFASSSNSLVSSTTTSSWTYNPATYGAVTGSLSDLIDTSMSTGVVLRTDFGSSSCAVTKLDLGTEARGRIYIRGTVDSEATANSGCCGDTNCSWPRGVNFYAYVSDVSVSSGCTFSGGSQVTTQYSGIANPSCGDGPAVDFTVGGTFYGRYIYLYSQGTYSSYSGNWLSGRGKTTLYNVDIHLE